MSPPSSDWPSLATPAVIDRATELTPPIAATPSAMQVRKMRKPDSPPRISRRREAEASCNGAGEAAGHAAGFDAGSRRHDAPARRLRSMRAGVASAGP